MSFSTASFIRRRRAAIRNDERHDSCTAQGQRVHGAVTSESLPRLPYPPTPWYSSVSKSPLARISILIYKDAGLISFQLATASGLLPAGTAIRGPVDTNGVSLEIRISGSPIKL